METLRSPLPTPRPPAAIGPLAGLRVLVVDDSAACRMIHAAMAAALGAEVALAETAAQAAAMAGEADYDLMILDIGLSDADGRVLTRTLREGGGGGEAAILCVSGLGDAGRRAGALAAGADGFAEKPFAGLPAFAAAALAALARDDGPADAPAGEAPPPLSPAVTACALEDLARGGRRLHGAVAAGDVRAVRRAAHFLSGVAGVISDFALAAAARRVETAGGDSGALRAVEAMLGRIAEATERLRPPTGAAS